MKPAPPIRVLVVEDQPTLAELHRRYVDRVDGFTTTAVVHTGREALAIILARQVDLVLLDFYLPDLGGLEVCRAMRSHGNSVDVIAVTSARDLRTIRDAVSHGVVHYLLKPFAFATLRDRLRRYAEYRAMAATTAVANQRELDRLMLRLLEPERASLPKNLRTETLSLVTTALRAANHASASDVATRVGASRVTVRRYLEHLVGEGLAEQTLRYGRTGRPEVLYRWREDQPSHRPS
ncbi:MAG TPA: response regulator [Jiangellales bacterium]|nr:response regulator [Jiangellales bacterium]